ncbi:acetate/propionate family kinase [Beduini massiliensis]|uniref:acetate/propionate family kinase n=1 Tax=Beduini massiliensis TaxID=1585974 RepID=UPI00059A955D|nr:acetate kinase [Beduini massiliensis]
MSMIIAVNAGSSSLKFQLYKMPGYEVLVQGNVERIGLESGQAVIKYNGKKEVVQDVFPTHKEGVDFILKVLLDYHIIASLDEIEACGHRIVHGGEYFNQSVVVDDDVVSKVEELCELAPLHNPAHLIGYHAFKEALPHSRHVFAFDTAFHQTLDKERYLYALPYEYYTDLGVRKYGAHGLSHQYVSQQVIQHLGNPKRSRIIVCHLGNGASISAVEDGKCIDTSMGFTPLSGVMMGTRSGDVDPSIMPYLCKKLNKTAQEVLDIYNKKSGMLGVSGISSDSRDVEQALFKEGNERALLTGLLYARNVSKYIGSYVMELGGVDVIAFTAGIGENVPYLRALIIDDVARALGCHIDVALNNQRSDESRVISLPSSQVEVMVVPTNEELVIVRDTVRLLGINEGE